MQRSFLVLIGCFLFIAGQAQNPVRWTVKTKKLDSKTCEVSIQAAIEEPWHIYSQTTPDAGPLPTKVVFKSNPLVELVGNVKEVGLIRKTYEEVFGIDVKYIEEKAEYVQLIRLKKPVKTNLSVRIEYMACTDNKCLPPDEAIFNIALQ